MDDDRDIEVLLHALADGEVDAVSALALEKKMANDPALKIAYDRIQALKTAVTRSERPIVSDAFAARIAALAHALVTMSPQTTETTTGVAKAWSKRLDWRAVAASLLMTAALASGITYSVTTSSRDGLSIQDAVIDGHWRSLLSANPIDIASSDRHKVRPWFDAKLGLAPPTPDLTAAGFELLGGRIDIVGDRPAPSLVYRYKEHLITVVAVPVSLGKDLVSEPAARTVGAYNVVRWNGPGFKYWAVSDLDAAKLDAFVSGMRAH